MEDRPILVMSHTHVLVTGPSGDIYTLPPDGLSPFMAGTCIDQVGPLITWGVACCALHFRPIASYRISLN